MQVAQAKPSGAFASLQKHYWMFERLSKQNSGNASCQRNLFVSRLIKTKVPDEPDRCYRAALAIATTMHANGIVLTVFRHQRITNEQL